MDQRHLLDNRGAHRGFQGTPYPTPQLPVRPPISPILRSPLPHHSSPAMSTECFPSPVFSGMVQPHIAYAGPASPHLIDRQRELKEASLMQAKLLQQRAILSHQVTPPHPGMEDRVQYVPAIMPNLSPEDSLTQLRRLHQQVLSMPSQEPHYYEVPSTNRPREAHEAELLRLPTKERMLMMEKYLSTKQPGSPENDSFARFIDRSQRHFPVQGQPSSSSVTRPTASRPPVFTHPDLASHEFNLRMQHNIAAENARIIQDMENVQRTRFTRHEPLLHSQKQIPSPNVVVVPQDGSSRIHPSYRSHLHASFVAGGGGHQTLGSKPPIMSRPDLPSKSNPVHHHTLPQIKNVKSLASASSGTEESITKRIDKRDILMKMMENKIKQELYKGEDSCPPSHVVHAKPKGEVLESCKMTKVPSHHSLFPNVSALPQRHFKQEPFVTSDGQVSLPKDLRTCQVSQANSGAEDATLRKRAAICKPVTPPLAKRSRGAGDIFKSRLAEYEMVSSSIRPPSGDGTVSSSILPAGSETVQKQPLQTINAEQPLDLSVNASQKTSEPQASTNLPPVPCENPFNISQLSNRKVQTWSDIISHAVAASLEKPHPSSNNDTIIPKEETTPVNVFADKSLTKDIKAESKADKSTTGAASATEEECQQQLIDLLSSQFAGSFRSFLVSLLREYKNENVVNTLAVFKAGDRVPIMMKEELERCNSKISKTIRALLESKEDKDQPAGNRDRRVSGETRVEKDKSPPCQVSTTTDIWQQSPPASPSFGQTLSKSQETKCTDEPTVQQSGSSKGVNEEDISSDPPADEVSEDAKDVKEDRRTPNVTKMESLASIDDKQSSSGKDDKVEVLEGLSEEYDTDVPLCIDDEAGETSSGENVFESMDSDQPVVENPNIEEDAIDLLEFGNEEIYLAEAKDTKEQTKSGPQNDDDNSENDEKVEISLAPTSPEIKTETTSLSNEVAKLEYPHSLSMQPISETFGEGPEHAVKDVERGIGSGVVGSVGVDVDIKEDGGRVDNVEKVSLNRGMATLESTEEGSTELTGKSAEEIFSKEGNNIISDGGNASAAAVSMNNCRENLSKPMLTPILPKQPSSQTVSTPSHSPVTVVSTPITFTLPKVYQIKPAQPTQLFQIVTNPATSKLMCTLAPTVNNMPASSGTISTLVTQPNQTLMASSATISTLVTQPKQTLISSVIPTSTVTSLPGSEFTNPPVQQMVSASSPSVSVSSTVSGSLPSAAPSSFPPTRIDSPTFQQPSSPSVFTKNATYTRFWKGNILIRHNNPKEQGSAKKAFVPAYTVSYHAADLPCVVRSSVPFIPPKILWKSLFPSVSFTQFNKTLSMCSILQRYMTVLEQAALQKDLTTNGISSCKLVPLDDFDNKYQDVKDHLSKLTTQDNSSSD